MTVRGALLYEQIRDHVLAEIRRGTLAPGARVASEMELAQQFKVSRITSKRALEVLRQAGVIERIRGKGSFVVRDLPDLGQLAVRANAPRQRSIADGRPSTFALILPDASESYGLELLCAVEERCAEHGINLIVRRTRGRQDTEEQAVETLSSGGHADGLIVLPVHGEYYSAGLLRAVVENFPLVLVDRYLSGIPVCAVHTDNVAAARALTERVLDAGHKHVAFVSTPPHNTTSIEERLEGFRAACTDRDLPPAQQHHLTDLRSTLPVAFTRTAVDADIERITDFIRRNHEVAAFVVCEYNLARVVAQAMPHHRPEPLIACFDSPLDPITGPAFLHVRQDQKQMGRQAVDLLLAQIRTEPVPTQSTVAFTIVERDDRPALSATDANRTPQELGTPPVSAS